MTSTVGASPATRSTGRSWYRLAWWCGILFVPIFVFGVLWTNDTPDSKASDQKWIDWYSHASHRTEQIIGVYALTVAAVLFLVFAAGVLDRLGAKVAVLTGAARATAIAFAVAVMVSGVNLAGISANITFGDTRVPRDADILRQGFGYGFLGVTSALAAAAFIALATTIARQTGEFGTGLSSVGYVLAVIELGGVIFLPMAALPVWVLVVAITFLRRPA